ncbi:MAG: type II secretion system F family protein [Alphaproteobacteria bacterium]|nr:type II secretion system F family protein [Alphaproteobacteria bacterium]
MSIENLLRNPDFLAGMCGLGAFAVVILIWTALMESDPLPARIKNVLQRKSELREAERRKKLSRRAGIARASLMKQVVQKLKLAQGKKIDELRLKLARAGYRSRDTMFAFLFMKLAMPVGLAFAAFFFVFVVHAIKLKHPALGFPIVMFFGILGLALPDLFIKNQSQKREKVLHKAMPDALDLLVICAEAGLSLDASFDRVSREIGQGCPELAEEIGLTSVELNFLPDRSKALQNLADRVPLPGVMALTNTLIQTEKYGTPLAQSLRVLSGEMREERIMAAEAKAAKLPATLTVPMILFILPPLFIVLLGPAIIKVSAVMK